MKVLKISMDINNKTQASNKNQVALPWILLEKMISEAYT